MRESFVLHAEYIEDLPEELKGAFLRYIYEYGINEIEPELSGLELTVWLKIKRRIDDDVSAYERKVSNLKQNKNRTATGAKSTAPTDNRTENTTEEEKPNGDRTDSVSVNVSVNDSVNVSDSVNVAEAKPAEPAPARKRFVKPELEEIREFCFEKNINIDVDRFFNYYESKGWKVGVSPMKDWKAAVRNWAKNDTIYQRPGTTRISSDTELLKNYTPPQTQTDVMANLAEIQGESTNAELEAEGTIIF